jgi:hypothetical protein
MRVDDDLIHTSLRQPLDDVGQGWTITDPDEGFGEFVRQRAQSGTQACAQNHGVRHGRIRATFAEKWPPGQTTCYRKGVRKYARFLSATLGFVVVPSVCAVVVSACGDDPVGIEACRLIESARCEATTACGVSEADATYCVAFYRDQCLHGMANTHAELSSASTNACVDAIRAAAACARAGAMSMAQCPTIALIAGEDPTTVLPCAVVKRTPQVLAACGFLTPNDDDGSSSSSSSSSGSAPDAGDDATDGS